MFDFKVKPDNGDPFEVTAEARDVVTWEKTSRQQRTFKWLMDTFSYVELYRLAHIASRRQGLFSGDLKEFEETCELEMRPRQDEDEEADPTLPAP